MHNQYTYNYIQLKLIIYPQYYIYYLQYNSLYQQLQLTHQHTLISIIDNPLKSILMNQRYNYSMNKIKRLIFNPIGSKFPILLVILKIHLSMVIININSQYIIILSVYYITSIIYSIVLKYTVIDYFREDEFKTYLHNLIEKLVKQLVKIRKQYS